MYNFIYSYLFYLLVNWICKTTYLIWKKKKCLFPTNQFYIVHKYNFKDTIFATCIKLVYKIRNTCHSGLHKTIKIEAKEESLLVIKISAFFSLLIPFPSLPFFLRNKNDEVSRYNKFQVEKYHIKDRGNH